MNRSLEIQNKLFEQEWYAHIVPLAKRLQSYLLGKGGIYFVDKKDFLRDFPDEDPQDLERAIEALRMNAAIFPVTGTDTYRINWKRLSSALL